MENVVTIKNKSRVVIDSDLDYIINSLTEEFSGMAGKNLLITGGAGFLGYYFVQSIDRWNISKYKDYYT
jgi:UDP-glucuronate decarboxylase